MPVSKALISLSLVENNYNYVTFLLGESGDRAQRITALEGRNTGLEGLIIIIGVVLGVTVLLLIAIIIIIALILIFVFKLKKDHSKVSIIS